jgi:hypothetical protein
MSLTIPTIVSRLRSLHRSCEVMLAPSDGTTVPVPIGVVALAATPFPVPADGELQEVGVPPGGCRQLGQSLFSRAAGLVERLRRRLGQPSSSGGRHLVGRGFFWRGSTPAGRRRRDQKRDRGVIGAAVHGRAGISTWPDWAELLIIPRPGARSAAGARGEGAGAPRISVAAGTIVGLTSHAAPCPVPVAAAARRGHGRLPPVHASTTGPSRHDSAGPAPRANRSDGPSTRR